MSGEAVKRSKPRGGVDDERTVLERYAAAPGIAWFTRDETAIISGMTTRILVRQANLRKGIPYKTLGGRAMYRKSDIEAFVNSQSRIGRRGNKPRASMPAADLRAFATTLDEVATKLRWLIDNASTPEGKALLAALGAGRDPADLAAELSCQAAALKSLLKAE